MKDLILVVVSVVLTGLLSRTWGHRRLLRQVHEQLAVLDSMPREWGDHRRSLEALAARDMAKYLKFRVPAFPLHRLMNRATNAGLVGALIGTFATMSFTPGNDLVKGAIAAAGFALAAVATTTNLIVFLTHGEEVSDELEHAAKRES